MAQHTMEAFALLREELRRERETKADLLAALIAIAQRANESGNDELGERETIYAMHGLARAAIARAEGSP
jgi:hypothetical protein